MTVQGRCDNAAVSSYYDLGAANERVGELRPLLAGLRDDRDAVAAARSAPDELAAIVRRMEAAVRQIDAWNITLRDIGTGLVDFPALANGRPIWLCWRLGEEDIAWWHELDSGIAGRRPLIELV